MEKFNFKKSLGQNFLIDNNIIEKIVSSIDSNSNDLIVEIGPGSGALTKKLKQKKGDLIAFEIDKSLEKVLTPLINGKTSIIFEDFLKVNLTDYIDVNKYDKIYVIGNLPYYITTPIIKKITNSKINFNKLVFMVQKEVGERFTASVNSKLYNSLSIYLQYNFEIKKICTVTKNAFIPKPKVDSVVLEFNKRKNKEMPKNEELFYSIVRKSFEHKRKTLKNNLTTIDKTTLNNLYKDLDLKENVRAEELLISDFIKISNYLS